MMNWITCLLLIASVSSYRISPTKPSILNGNVLSNGNHLRDRSISTSLHALDPKTSEKTSIQASSNNGEFVMAPTLDAPSWLRLFLGQSILLTFVIVLELFTEFKVIPPVGDFEFNLASLKVGVLWTLPVIAAGYLSEFIPVDIVKEINRSVKVFSIRLLGRSTPIPISFIGALVLAISGGTSSNIL